MKSGEYPGRGEYVGDEVFASTGRGVGGLVGVNELGSATAIA